MTQDAANAEVAQRPVVAYFVLVTALTIPFWLLDAALADFQVLPGIPASAFSFVVPAVSAAILVYRQRGSHGIGAWLRQALRIGPKLWLVPACLIMPAIVVLSYWVLRLSGVPIPAAQLAALPALGLFIAFVPAAAGEELGWSSYVADPMQVRWGGLAAALGIGAFWAAWHLPNLVHVGRSPAWIAWWALGTIATRVILVWLYNSSARSVLPPVLGHASYNVAWQLFPINGSYYDPKTASLIMALVAVAVVLIGKPRLQSVSRLSAAPTP